MKEGLNYNLCTHLDALLSLSRMMADGNGEHPACERYRSIMEGTWQQMPPDEQEICRKLSEAIYRP